LTGPMEGRFWPFELAWRRWPALLRGLLFGFVAITATVAVVALLGGYRITGFNPAYSPWTDLLSVGLRAAIAEEIMYRGVLFRLVEDLFGTWVAVAVSGLVFGLSHLGNPDATLMGGIAIAVEAGLLFAAIYAVSRNLWWTIGLHFAWNVTEGPVYGSIISGTSDQQQSWITAQWPGSSWLTGGQFGVEASVVPMMLLGLVGVWLLVRAQKAGYIIAPWWVRRRMLRARTASTGPSLPQRGVLAVQGDQLVMGTQLGDPAVDHDGDPLGVVGGVQAVGDRDDGASLKQG